LKEPVGLRREPSQPWLVQTRYVYFMEEEGVAPKRRQRQRGWRRGLTWRFHAGEEGIVGSEMIKMLLID